MEYIKKEELIKGEIYKASNESLTFIMKATKNLYDVINIPSYNEFMKSGNFNGSYLTFINATPEEKHWLNECIKLDKFITFEEAMKTFVSEYVECINPGGWKQTIKNNNDNLIFDTKIESIHVSDNSWKKVIKDTTMSFKPSTKEAYDAQFVVKEPEFVLPEKWCIKSKNEEELQTVLKFKQIELCEDALDLIYYRHFPFIKPDCTCYLFVQNGYIEITFDQFKKYVLKEKTVEEKVIEPLPQFKIIESIETITKVENNEGNQFFIGDIVISDSGFVQTIKSFRYNVNKDNVLATTNICNQISIARLEHYIEPKVEETLLEKAKKLYPIGTKFRVACNPKYIGTVKDHKDYPFQDVDIVNLNTIENIDGCTGMTVFYKGKWAEIINE